MAKYEGDWKIRKCKIPGVIGGYTFDTEDGTELWVREQHDGTWRWYFTSHFVGVAKSKQQAQSEVLLKFQKLLAAWHSIQ